MPSPARQLVNSVRAVPQATARRAHQVLAQQPRPPTPRALAPSHPRRRNRASRQPSARGLALAHTSFPSSSGPPKASAQPPSTHTCLALSRCRVGPVCHGAICSSPGCLRQLLSSCHAHVARISPKLLAQPPSHSSRRRLAKSYAAPQPRCHSSATASLPPPCRLLYVLEPLTPSSFAASPKSLAVRPEPVLAMVWACLSPFSPFTSLLPLLLPGRCSAPSLSPRPWLTPLAWAPSLLLMPTARPTGSIACLRTIPLRMSSPARPTIVRPRQPQLSALPVTHGR
jgi:hypothetical protein